MEIVIKAAPASLPGNNSTGSVNVVSSNNVISNEGMTSSPNPVMASTTPVIFKNNFNLRLLLVCFNSVDSVISVYFTMLSNSIRSKRIIKVINR